MAAAAGNGHNAAAMLQAQPGLAAGTFEILVGFAVLEAYLRLAAFGALLFGKGHIAAVLCTALFQIARKGAVNAEHIAGEAQQAQKHAQKHKNDRLCGTENGTQQIQDQSAPQKSHGKLIRAIAAVHERTQGLLDLFPE